MIRRNTWLLLVVLALVISLAVFLQNRKTREAAQATPTPGSAMVFGPADGAPTDIRFDGSVGDSVEFGRDQSGTWVVKAPHAGPADQAAAEAAATQVGALRVFANVSLGAEVVGLDKPSYIIMVTFDTGKVHKLAVGSITPIQNGYYAQLDAGSIEVVDKLGIDALAGLLTQPPYLATLTPPASATPLGTATQLPQSSPTVATTPAASALPTTGTTTPPPSTPTALATATP